MTPSLEGLPTKAKEAPSSHEVRMSPLDTNPVFQSLFCFLGLYTNLHNMMIFGLCFILLFMKWSGRNGIFLGSENNKISLLKT